jgi:hypothetical protein
MCRTQHVLLIVPQNATASHAAIVPAADSAETTAFENLHDERTRVIGELQARWRCEVHSKDKDVHCWTATPGGVCYVLNLSNLGFWAVDIVSTEILSKNYISCY